MNFVRLVVLLCLGWASAGATDWEPVTWHGERAFASASAGWRAVVSVTRGRLMHFGPAAGDSNLLLAPPTRENRNRFGGHRLWLGPQAEWPRFWPPPAAWEYVEPASVAIAGGVLRLIMPATGDDWPQLTRTYRWVGASLVCGAELTGGSRAVQVVHIVQVPPGLIATAEARPEERFPAGYVKLPTHAEPFAARFESPPHVTRADHSLTVRHTGEVVKLGFRPQTLTGRLDEFELRVARGAQTGETAGDPDEGFHTQVFCSAAAEAMTELEQLSPRFAAGQPATFEIILTGRALRP